MNDIEFKSKRTFSNRLLEATNGLVFCTRNALWSRCHKVKEASAKEGDHFCSICNNKLLSFEPYGISEELFRKHHIIGGGHRENCTCPWCGCGDRERWLNYVLKKHTDIMKLQGRILHFAPESSVMNMVKQNKEIDYYTADIVFGRARSICDITDIQYGDNTFDYVISNHVLEHISDEAMAVSEVMRVLKDSGVWILSFPICTDMKTFEDSSIVTQEQRLKYYGQEDHVRLYGNDFKERIERYGLNLEIYSPRNELSPAEIDYYGFIEDDIILFATKK